MSLKHHILTFIKLVCDVISKVLLLLLLSHFSRVWLCNPIDGSPPGSPVPGSLQARTLEWVAISFSNAWKWKVKVKSLSRVWLLATPWTAAHQAPPSLGLSRQECWSGVPLGLDKYFVSHLKTFVLFWLVWAGPGRRIKFTNKLDYIRNYIRVSWKIGG